MSLKSRGCRSLSRVTLCLIIVSLLGASAAYADQSNNAGRTLVNQMCTACHGLAPIEATRNGSGGWRGTVFDMIDKGAQLQTPANVDSIVNYLSATYGPSAGEMNTGALPAGSHVKSDGTAAKDYLATLPAAKGVDLVKGYCSICHDVGRIVATRRSAEEWNRYTRVMLARIGAPANKQASDAIAAYLSANFGAPEQKSR